MTSELERITLETALISLVACAVAAAVFDARHEAVSLGTLFTAGLVVLIAVARRLVAPSRMRHVVSAVRDAPSRVVSLRHHIGRTRALLLRITTGAGLAFAVSLAGAALAIPLLILVAAIVVLVPLARRILVSTWNRFVVAARDTSMAAGKPDHTRSWIEIGAYSRRVTLTVSDGGDAMFDLLMRRCPSAKVAWPSSHDDADDPSSRWK